MNTWKYIKEHYIDQHIKIFPIEKNGKKPLIENWMNDCSCDYMQVLYWYTNSPECNWGMPCTPNNLFVLDLDVHDPDKNGIENYNKIESTLFDEDELYDITYMLQNTPSGGKHLIFRSDDDLKNVLNGSNVFKDYPGIDIRTSGYVVVAPSKINGVPYNFEAYTIPNIMPDKLKKFILDNANTTEDVKKEEYKKPLSVEKGDRDNQLFLYISNVYYKTRLDYDEVLVLAKYFNETILEEPLPNKVVEYKVKKIFQKDRMKCLFVYLNDE